MYFDGYIINRNVQKEAPMFFCKKRAIVKRINQANALFDTGNRKQAFEEFKNLQQEFPDNPEILFGLAILQNSVREHHSAIETLKSVLKIDRNHKSAKCILPTIIYEYAVQLAETGENELAKKYLRDFISLDNGNKADLANGYKELAIVEENLGNIREAKKFIEKAIEISSKNVRSNHSESYSTYYTEVLIRLNSY
jgi:tetratricopeptide (TPR) repeat protein